MKTTQSPTGPRALAPATIGNLQSSILNLKWPVFLAALARASAARTCLRGRCLAAGAALALLLGSAARLSATTFNEAGNVLRLDVNVPSQPVFIVSAGASYTLTLMGGDTWVGANSANVTGKGTDTLTVTPAGLATFDIIDLTDSASGTGVSFQHSGANTYGDMFVITLDDAGAGPIIFNGTSSFITGTAALIARTSQKIVVSAGASVTTANGDLSLRANQQPTPTTGSFYGVEVQGLIQATGAGAVTVDGKGGNGGAGSQFGVYVHGGGDIIGGTSGPLTVRGTGGPSSGIDNVGVYVSGAGSTITSGGGDVWVTGWGGGSGNSGRSHGVVVASAGQVNAGGSGRVAVQGIGGAGSGERQHGVLVIDAGSTITSGGGNVQVTGIEGGGPSGFAIQGISAAVTTLANGGTLTLVGNSMSFNTASTISAQPGSSVTLRPFTSGVAINLGAATDPTGGPLSLSDAELDLITAGTIVIGDASSGNITISAPITPAGTAQVELVTGGAIAGVGTPGITTTRLGLTAGTGIGTSGNPLNTTVANVEATTVTGGIFIDEAAILIMADGRRLVSTL